MVPANGAIARVLTSLAMGFLVLLCRAALAVGAEPVPQPAPARDTRDAAPSNGAGNEQQLQQIDRRVHDGQYMDAETQARAALLAMDAGGEGDTYAAAQVADRLVEALLQGGKGTRPEALAFAQRAVALKEKLIGRQDAEVARSLERLGRVLVVRNDPEAQPTLLRALGLLEASLGPDHLDVALARNSLGEAFLVQAGDSDAAMTWLKQALAIRERAAGPDTPVVADTLRLIGQCLSSKGDFEAATSYLRHSVEIYVQALGPEHPEVASSLTALGHSLLRSGDYAGAEANLERALQILDGALGSDSPLAASTLSWLGWALGELGDFSAAVPLMERSVAIHVSEFGADSTRTAGALQNQAFVLSEVGESSRAVQLEKAAAGIYEKALGPWHPELATALNNEGVTLAFDLGDYAAAEPVLDRALAIREKQFGGDSHWVAAVLSNLAGGVYCNVGEYGKARDYLVRALAIREKHFGPNHILVANILENLSTATRGLGDQAEAVRYAERALAIRENILGSNHPRVAELLINHARLLAESGRTEAALADAVSGESMSRDHLLLTARTTSERQTLVYASKRAAALNLLVSMGVQHKGEDSLATAAWDSIIRSRALVLDEMLQRRKSTGPSTDPEIKDLVENVNRTTAQLAGLIVRGPNPEDAVPYPVALDDARKAKERAEFALAAKSEKYRQQRAWNHAGFDDVAAVLPPNTALVAFVRYQGIELAKPKDGKSPLPLNVSSPSYAAFVLPGSGASPVLLPLGDAARIERAVARWRETVTQVGLAAGREWGVGELTYRKAGADLRRVVWDPIAAHLGGAATVFIVPDGALSLVTFTALPAGEKRYVIEDARTIHYLSAERDLLTPNEASSGGGLLALGNPDFGERRLFAALGAARSGATPVTEEGTANVFRGSRSVCGSFQSMRFQPLPASVQETNEITRIWNYRVNVAHGLRAVRDPTEVAQVFTGRAANETMFKRSAGGHRVLHIATHGFFLGGDCASALDSPTTGRAAAESGAVTRENPLLLSGLAFAGANHRESAGPDEDDGILTAQEISTLDLRGTEWAVLSACDTGTGEIRAGEGVFGLRRAFQLAGARTVIMSLWPVEDEATRQWMTALYRHRFGEGKTTAESVNDASRELLQQRRARGQSTHPFYWAGFIAAGAWQ